MRYTYLLTRATHPPPSIDASFSFSPFEHDFLIDRRLGRILLTASHRDPAWGCALLSAACVFRESLLNFLSAILTARPAETGALSVRGTVKQHDSIYNASSPE